MAREGGRERDGDRDDGEGGEPPPVEERTAETVIAVDAREGERVSEYGADDDPRELAGIFRHSVKRRKTRQGLAPSVASEGPNAGQFPCALLSVP